jgi:hypothetical protein
MESPEVLSAVKWVFLFFHEKSIIWKKLPPDETPFHLGCIPSNLAKHFRA